MTADATTTSPERQRYAVRRGCEFLKREISIEVYAAEHTGLKAYDDSLRGCCPIHAGSNPSSFVVTPSKGLFYCHSCGHGGDLIDLCELVERHADTWTAMLSLAQRYGLELPTRPERWHKWQDEKGKRRSMIVEALTGLYQRRFFAFFRSDLLDIADAEERAQAAEALWSDLAQVARHCAILRASREES